MEWPHDPAAALAVICRTTRALCGAEGLAIALHEGSEMVCRASSGAAPAVGVRLGPDSRLSAECLRKRAVVRCQDAEFDRRFDDALRHRLGFGSAVVVPILDGKEPKGVLAAMYGAPYGFDHRVVARLERIAELIAEHCRYSEATLPEPQPQPVSESQFKDEGGQEPEPPLTQESARPVRTPLPSNVCDACGHVNLLSTLVCEKCDIPLPAALAACGPIAAESPRPVEPDREIVRPRRVPIPQPVARRRMARISRVAAVVVLTGAACLGFLQFRHRLFPPKAAPVQPLAAPTTESPSAPDLNTAPAVQVAEGEPQAPPADVSPAAAKVRPQSRASAHKPPAQDRRKKAAEQAANHLPDARTISLTTPADTSAGGITGGEVLHRVLPEYPEPAMALRVRGTVVLKAVVTRQGTVDRISVISGDPHLAEAAVNAVKQWRYQPYLLNGVPIERDTTITINFKD
jgi:protein TonB